MRAGRGPAHLRPAHLRRVVMALHWSAMILLVAWLAGMAPGWLLALHALLWAAISLIWGLRGGPSPALPAPLGRALVWGQGGLLALYLGGAVLAALGWPAAPPVLLATLGAATLHAALNLWRAGVLGDGAFRRMLPRALH